MKYPVAIHKDKDSCFGATVPDIPGCFSAGDSLDRAINNVQEAISTHLELLSLENKLSPIPSVVEVYIKDPDYRGATWAYIDLSTLEKSFVI